MVAIFGNHIAGLAGTLATSQAVEALLAGPIAFSSAHTDVVVTSPICIANLTVANPFKY